MTETEEKEELTKTKKLARKLGFSMRQSHPYSGFYYLSKGEDIQCFSGYTWEVLKFLEAAERGEKYERERAVSRPEDWGD